MIVLISQIVMWDTTARARWDHNTEIKSFSYWK